MKRYTFQAVDLNGTRIKGTVRAKTDAEVVEKLAKRGYKVIACRIDFEDNNLNSASMPKIEPTSNPSISTLPVLNKPPEATPSASQIAPVSNLIESTRRLFASTIDTSIAIINLLFYKTSNAIAPSDGEKAPVEHLNKLNNQSNENKENAPKNLRNISIIAMCCITTFVAIYIADILFSLLRFVLLLACILSVIGLLFYCIRQMNFYHCDNVRSVAPAASKNDWRIVATLTVISILSGLLFTLLYGNTSSTNDIVTPPTINSSAPQVAGSSNRSRPLYDGNLFSDVQLRGQLNGVFKSDSEMSFVFFYPAYNLDMGPKYVATGPTGGIFEIYSDHPTLTPVDQSDGVKILAMSVSGQANITMSCHIGIKVDEKGIITEFTVLKMNGHTFPADKQSVLKRIR